MAPNFVLSTHWASQTSLDSCKFRAKVVMHMELMLISACASYAGAYSVESA